MARAAHLSVMDTQATSPRTLVELALPELTSGSTSLRRRCTTWAQEPRPASGPGRCAAGEMKDWLARMEADDGRRRDRGRQ